MTTPRTFAALKTLEDALRDRLERDENLSPVIVEAIDTLDRFIHDMTDEAPSVNVAELTRLLDTAEWEWRADWNCWFAYHDVGGPIADALGWECGSCRPDVGWADWTSARKDNDGVITLHVECGHCGNTYAYDADGNDIDE